MTDAKNVLSLFDLSTVAVQPWADAGYHCSCVDIQHTTRLSGDIEVFGIDITQRDWDIDPGYYSMVMAFPPCTHLAVSGARWFKGKGLRALAEAIELVARAADICEDSGAPYFIENPVSTLSTYWRKPDYMFDPCDYAGYLDDPAPEAYTKRTCLWTGGGFVMPEPKRVDPVLGSVMHRIPPGDERSNIRSRTPMGFAKAVFAANGVQP